MCAFGVCNCCGRKSNLYIHHWFEQPNLERHTMPICNRCNAILAEQLSQWGWSEVPISKNHIMPNWETQKGYAIKRYLEKAEDYFVGCMCGKRVVDFHDNIYPLSWWRKLSNSEKLEMYFTKYEEDKKDKIAYLKKWESLEGGK